MSYEVCGEVFNRRMHGVRGVADPSALKLRRARGGGGRTPVSGSVISNR